MTVDAAPKSKPMARAHWALRGLANPYLLLATASLFWSGNHIVGRAMGGHVPPLSVSTIRWLFPVAVLWAFAHKQIRADWPIIRAHWKIMLWLGATGGARGIRQVARRAQALTERAMQPARSATP